MSIIRVLVLYLGLAQSLIFTGASSPYLRDILLNYARVTATVLDAIFAAMIERLAVAECGPAG